MNLGHILLVAGGLALLVAIYRLPTTDHRPQAYYHTLIAIMVASPLFLFAILVFAVDGKRASFVVNPIETLIALGGFIVIVVMLVGIYKKYKRGEIRE